MFTGIVLGTARVEQITETNYGYRLVLAVPQSWCQHLVTGASVAVDGVCLTVTAQTEASVCFDVIPETLRKTNLGNRRVGDEVNIERSLRVGDELGGHQVSGHVHVAVPLLAAGKQQGGEVSMRLALPAEHAAYLLPKGFVAINGVSLTVGEVEPGSFTVYLIPETLGRTNLAQAVPGDRLNLEFDQSTRTIVHTVHQLLQADGASSFFKGTCSFE